MLIAHVLFQTAATDRPDALRALLAEAETVRTMPGCLLYQPFADPGTETGIGIVHEWESAEAFATYTSSPLFASWGEILRPLMTRAPVSKRFEAEPIEAVG